MEKSRATLDKCQTILGGGCLESLKVQMKAEIREKAVLCRFEDSESVDAEEILSGRKIWALLKGELHLIMRDEEGRTIVLQKILPEHSGFTLPALCLDSHEYSIEVVCVGETELYYIPEQLSARMYSECADVRKWQEQCYVKAFTKLLELINDLSFLSLKERLRKKLYEYCDQYRTDTVLVTHENLADELATSREVVSRLLKKMEAEKIIKIKRKSIQVLGWKGAGYSEKVSRMAV